MPWTEFHFVGAYDSRRIDGRQYLYIEAGEYDARSVIYNRFDKDPKSGCPCCGSDYLTTEAESLELLTAPSRGCEFRDGHWDLATARQSLGSFLRDPEVYFLRAKHIDPDETEAWIYEEACGE